MVINARDMTGDGQISANGGAGKGPGGGGGAGGRMMLIIGARYVVPSHSYFPFLVVG